MSAAKIGKRMQSDLMFINRVSGWHCFKGRALMKRLMKLEAMHLINITQYSISDGSFRITPKGKQVADNMGHFWDKKNNKCICQNANCKFVGLVYPRSNNHDI